MKRPFFQHKAHNCSRTGLWSSALPACLHTVFLLLIHFAVRPAQAQKIGAVLNYARFRADSVNNLLELSLSFEGSGLKITKLSSGKYQCGVQVLLRITDTSGAVVKPDKFNLLSPESSDSLSLTNNLSVARRYALPNGNYNLSVQANDLHLDSNSLKAEVPVTFSFPKGKMFFSDLQLLASFKESKEKGEYTKYGYEMLPYPLSFYPAKTDRLIVYTELYNSDKIVGKDSAFVLTFFMVRKQDGRMMKEIGSIERVTAKPLIARIKELDISQLPSGTYELTVEAISRKKAFLGRQTKIIERLNPSSDDVADITADYVQAAPGLGTFTDNLTLAEASKQLQAASAIASNAEQHTISSLENSHNERRVKDYLYEFWHRRDKEHPEIAYQKYVLAVAYAEKHYHTATMRSYNTDRGRVYLQYGKPNQVENEYNDKQRTAMNNSTITPYEIWHYYHTERGNQNNVVFVFVQESLGNNNYKLLHSSAIGEVKYTNWRNAIANRNNAGNNQFNLPDGP